MYTRQYKTKKTSTNSAETSTTNQFAPRRFVVQPDEEITNNQTSDLQAKSDKKRNLPNISVFPSGVTPQPSPIQMKLTIGQPGDKYEQEADRLAADVVQQINAPENQQVQREAAPEEEEVQMKPMVQRLSGAGGMSATPDLEQSIQQARKIKLQEMANNSLQAQQAAQLQIAANHPAQQQQPSQKKANSEPGAKENNTGLPDDLKAGVENLSGYSLDDVRVNYNSPKPAKLQALAYTQGTEIHVAPGQEEHLSHEAWHVVQQKQGRVKPTMQMKGVQINDDEGLEREADVMGGKSNHMTVKEGQQNTTPDPIIAAIKQKSPLITETVLCRREKVTQRQEIGKDKVDVYVDNANYPYWEQEGVKWHLTMKDPTRWHITKDDRSASYWFEVSGGDVTSTEPRKTEYGSQKKKHHSLDKAPATVRKFIMTHIMDIIHVTDTEDL